MGRHPFLFVPAASRGPVCPLAARDGLERSTVFRGRAASDTDAIERLCSRCGEWWPADTEFFVLSPGTAGGLATACRACRLQHSPRRPPRMAVRLRATPQERAAAP